MSKHSIAARLTCCTAWLCVCVLMLSVSEAVAFSADSLQVPFEYAHKRDSLLIHLQVNKKPAVLIIDTGSSHTILRPELLGIKPSELIPTDNTTSGGAFLGDAIGREVDFQVGSWKWPKRRIAVMDLSRILSVYEQEIDGVLGLDFFQEFRSVTINIEKKTIVFVK